MALITRGQNKEINMEPVSIIVAALVSGAAAAAKETGAEAINDAYQGLKKLFIRQWKKATDDEAKAEFLIQGLETNPEAIEQYVRDEVQKTMPDPDSDLLVHAQKLCELLEQNGHNVAKYNVKVEGSQGVAVGDGITQNNNFGR